MTTLDNFTLQNTWQCENNNNNNIKYNILESTPKSGEFYKGNG